MNTLINKIKNLFSSSCDFDFDSAIESLLNSNYIPESDFDLDINEIIAFINE